MTDSAEKLAPNTDDTKQTLTDNVNANTVITAYAHAMVNVQLNPVPGLDQQPDWFDEMQKNLKTAKKHANNWIENIGPEVFSKVPQSIINYNNLFCNATNDIIKIIDESGGNPSDEQKSKIIRLLQATLSELNSQKDAISSAHDSLVTFNDNIQADAKNLLDGKNGALSALREDKDKVIEIQGDIANLNDQLAKDQTAATVSEIGIGVGIFLAVAGFALAVATGGAAAPLVVGAIGVLAVGGSIAGTVIFNKDISEDLRKINDKQNELNDEQAQISALQTIICTVDQTVALNQKAQNALSAVLDMYSVLSDKMDSVINDVEKASNDQIGSIIQELDLQTAQTAWEQLKDFAQKIENLSITNQGTVTPPDQKAQVA